MKNLRSTFKLLIGVIHCFIAMTLLTGCLDRFEINNYAFWIGSALDETENSSVLVSAQIAVPSEFKSQQTGSGKTGKGSIIVSSIGKSTIDALQGIQDKLPRKIFIGHRRAVFIGEKFARRGIKESIDQFARNPDTRLRTDIFIIRKGLGLDALKLVSPFSTFSSVAAVDQDKFCRLGDIALRDFMVDSNREGIRPIMPVIEMDGFTEGEKNNSYTIKSMALFNKEIRLVDFLEEKDSLNVLWMRGSLKDLYITEKTNSGTYAIYETNLKKRLTVRKEHGGYKFSILLSGRGRILENQGGVDLLDSKSLLLMEKEMNDLVTKDVETTLRKIMKSGQDAIGLGECLHRTFPKEWAEIKKDWDAKFPNSDVSVKVDLNLRLIGNIGKPALIGGS